MVSNTRRSEDVDARISSLVASDFFLMRAARPTREAQMNALTARVYAGTEQRCALAGCSTIETIFGGAAT